MKSSVYSLDCPSSSFSLPVPPSRSSQHSHPYSQSELSLDSFDRSLKSLQDLLASLESSSPPPPRLALSDINFVPSNRYLELLHQFNQLISSTPSISSYDHNRLQATLKAIQTRIDRLSDSITNRSSKKFSFSRPLNPPSSNAPSCTPPPPSTAIRSPSNPLLAPLDHPCPLGDLTGLSSILLRPAPTTLLAPLHTLALVDLSSAVLDLRPLAHLGSLHLARLSNVALVASPLSGSAFCDHLDRSILLLVAHQLRIHRSKSLALLLHTHTSPVIEASSKLTLAPYPAHLFPVPNLPPSLHNVPQDFDHPSCPDGRSPNLIILTSCPVDEHILLDIFSGPPLDTGKHHVPIPDQTSDALRLVLEKLFPSSDL